MYRVTNESAFQKKVKIVVKIVVNQFYNTTNYDLATTNLLYNDYGTNDTPLLDIKSVHNTTTIIPLVYIDIHTTIIPLVYRYYRQYCLLDTTILLDTTSIHTTIIPDNTVSMIRYH